MEILNDTGAKMVNDVLTGAGFACHLVGGAVRDSVLGLTPKDIDLTTDATPAEMIALFEANPVTRNVILTGAAHGTVTVVINHVPYEVTTYRIDVETDGRHAVVEFTRDLVADLKRRDLTMNAIAMDFSGDMVDPFNGREDIQNNRVRFVGVAEERLREDYLRILRWFRFYGRFGAAEPDAAAISAIEATTEGLRQISVERIWAEVSKIVSGPNALRVIDLMMRTGVAATIRMPVGSTEVLDRARAISRDPAFLMGAYTAHVEPLAQRWKWSSMETKTAMFVASRVSNYSLARAKFDAVEGVDVKLIIDTLKLVNRSADAMTMGQWEVPSMPVMGRDLIEAGWKPGKEMGDALKEMKKRWVASDYKLNKQDLM